MAVLCDKSQIAAVVVPVFLTVVKHVFFLIFDMGIITDVALDPYTSHGQDGLELGVLGLWYGFGFHAPP